MNFISCRLNSFSLIQIFLKDLYTYIMLRQKVVIMSIIIWVRALSCK